MHGPLLNCWGGNVTLLSDLTDERIPKYLALTVLNGWKRTVDSDEYHLATLESGGKLRLSGDKDKICVELKHVSLVEAMALSGAAVAYRMGGIGDHHRFWQVAFGFGLGNWISIRDSHKVKWILTIAGQCLLPICAFLMTFFKITPLIMLIPLSILFILVTVGLLSDPDWNLTSWIFHFQWLLNLFATLGLNIYGGKPLPPEAYLSDGAHGDNMALFPLLASQSYQKIIICDGTEDLTESCNNLIVSINLARTKLRCSFLTVDGQTDVEEEIKRFVEVPDLAFLKFKVIYHQDSGDVGNLSSSEIIYLKPRRGFARHSKFNNNLNGCFCECCHTEYCVCTTACCGSFPQHVTLNQFFTEVQFEQYSLLGYRTAQFYLSKNQQDPPVSQ